MRLARYRLSQDKNDLDKSIVHCTEAILLPPSERSNNIVRLLFDIACALLQRTAKFGHWQPHDIKYSIEYLRYLRGLPLNSFHVPRSDVTTSLIAALANQVLSDAEDGTQRIKEMVDLCRELLTSTLWGDFPDAVFTHLNLAVDAEYFRGRDQSMDQAIECLRDAAKMCPPESHSVFFALARLLRTRFSATHSNDDYEEAMAIFEWILHPNRPGECPDRDIVLAVAAQLAAARSKIFGRSQQHAEETISRLRAFLNAPSADDQHHVALKVALTVVLESQVGMRFDDYHLAESLEETKSYRDKLVDLTSSQSLEESGEHIPVSDAVWESHTMTKNAEAIQIFKELLSKTPPGSYIYGLCLSSLARLNSTKSHSTNDISDIEVTIKYCRLSLDATLSSDPGRIALLFSLCDILILAFSVTGKISHLDESIIVCYDILKVKTAQSSHLPAVHLLVRSLLTREELLGRTEDRHEAIRVMSTVVDNQYAREPDRFRLACQWAVLARSIGHSTTLTAYESAMSLVQRSLSFAPTVSIQHTRLVEMGVDCQTTPLDYASFQMDLGRFEEAVETLEQGRALIWSEMRSLRSPAAQLIDDSSLAGRFAEINEELEALTISVPPSGKPETEDRDSVAQVGDGMDPFGRLLVKRKKLLEEREALISQIQGRPGLEGFLKMPSFTTVRSASSRGPVILINHCKWRSDILILIHNSPPCIIPILEGFYDRANKMRDGLFEARKHGLDSDEYQDALCSVLKGLYVLVGEPVIERLRTLGVPEQSRIWLCPTSVFCSLPLHAMGPIPTSDTSDERYFSDLYIPSYTPSLSALIESHKASPHTLTKPSLLLVAQPDYSLPGVSGEVKVIQRTLQARVTVTGLVSSGATPSSVVEGLQGSRFAHFACHGVLETGKPFEASFKLHGGSRLTLLEIVQSRLPGAEFAFLSCCHAAEITEDSVADEALHLAAAMQYCGFRSVVGTMWEMADTDGRDLAKSFYNSLFAGQDGGVPYYERSARALRDATAKLRRKRGISLERWVNFVHYGA